MTLSSERRGQALIKAGSMGIGETSVATMADGTELAVCVHEIPGLLRPAQPLACAEASTATRSRARRF